MQIYYNPKFDWRSYDALHLLTSHRYYRNLTSYSALKHCNEALKNYYEFAVDLHFNKTPVFDENNIREYEYPIGDMAREVLDKFTGIID